MQKNVFRSHTKFSRFSVLVFCFLARQSDTFSTSSGKFAKRDQKVFLGNSQKNTELLAERIVDNFE